MIRILPVIITITRMVRDADTTTEKMEEPADIIMEKAETVDIITIIKNSSCIQTE